MRDVMTAAGVLLVVGVLAWYVGPLLLRLAAFGWFVFARRRAAAGRPRRPEPVGARGLRRPRRRLLSRGPRPAPSAPRTVGLTDRRARVLRTPAAPPAPHPTGQALLCPREHEPRHGAGKEGHGDEHDTFQARARSRREAARLRRDVERDPRRAWSHDTVRDVPEAVGSRRDPAHAVLRHRDGEAAGDAQGQPRHPRDDQECALPHGKRGGASRRQAQMRRAATSAAPSPAITSSTAGIWSPAASSRRCSTTRATWSGSARPATSARTATRSRWP